MLLLWFRWLNSSTLSFYYESMMCLLVTLFLFVLNFQFICVCVICSKFQESSFSDQPSGLVDLKILTRLWWFEGPVP